MNYPNEDRDRVLDAMKKMQDLSFQDGKKEGLKLALKLRGFATLKPVNQKLMLEWIDLEIENYKKDNYV